MWRLKSCCHKPRNCQTPRESLATKLSSAPSTGAWPCWHLEFGLLASVNFYCSKPPSLQYFYGNPKEPSFHLNSYPLLNIWLQYLVTSFESLFWHPLPTPTAEFTGTPSVSLLSLLHFDRWSLRCVSPWSVLCSSLYCSSLRQCLNMY